MGSFGKVEWDCPDDCEYCAKDEDDETVPEDGEQ